MIRSTAEIEANLLHQPLNYHQRFTCPCCGTNTLMTFQRWTETRSGRSRPHKANCFLCTYTVGLRIGEPMEFGIMNETIFNYLE